MPLVEVGPVDSGADDLLRADELESADDQPPIDDPGVGPEAEVAAADRARERYFRDK